MAEVCEFELHHGCSEVFLKDVFGPKWAESDDPFAPSDYHFASSFFMFIVNNI